MTLNTIDVGAAPDDGTGDPLRTAFTKTNAAIDELNGLTTSSTKLVRSEADFPAPVAGVITLEDNITYKVEGTVTCTNRIEFGATSPIIGELSTTSTLVYVGSDTFLTATNQRMYVSDVGVVTTNPAATLLSKAGTELCVFRCFFINCAGDFGSINSDNDIIFQSGLCIFSGTGVSIKSGPQIPYFEFSDARIIQNSGNPCIDVTGSDIDDVVISACQFIPAGNGVSIAADANSVNVNVKAIVRDNDFKLAFGQTWLGGGLTVKDINWVFRDNIGLGTEPSQVIGTALLSGNATVTPITANTPVTPSGTYASSAEDQRMQSAAGSNNKRIRADCKSCVVSSRNSR